MLLTPNWNLTDRNPYFVVPIDTLRIVAETPGLVKNVTFRPSKRTQFKKRLNTLTKEEKVAFHKVVESKDPEKIDGNKRFKARVLDTAMDFIDYKFSEEILMKKSKEAELKTKFLIARAKLGIKSEPFSVPIPKEETPHIGHKTRRLETTIGTGEKADLFGVLGYRFALNDLLDRSTGQNPLATMEMGNFRFRYNLEDEDRDKRSSFRFQEFSLVKVTSLSPIEQYFTSLTWRATFGARTITDGGCFDCFAPTAQVGMGFAFKFSEFLAYVMATPEFDANKRFGHRGIRAGIGPEGRIIWRPNQNLSWDIYAEYKRQFFVKRNKETYTWGSENRYHYSRNFSFGLQFRKYKPGHDLSLRSFIYF